MIVYELGCAHGHRFEGWFASGDDFARQNEAHLVRCPVCDDATIAVVPSAKFRVARQGAAVADAPATEPAETSMPGPEAVAGLSPEIVRKLREIVRNTENVGRRFPEEARRIHYEEVPPRPIRGQASPDEAESLREEGIEFASLPPFLTREPN
jgi:hypothetical protein